MIYQKIAIAMPLEDEQLETLHSWGQRFDFSHVKEIHFIHVVKKSVTPLEFGLMELPSDETYQDMIPTLRKFLENEAARIVPKDFHGDLRYHIEADFDPEKTIEEIVKNVGADLVVAATRGMHGFKGLFHGSFTDHLVKFAPCDVYVVRPEAS